ncbi:enoyl-CoA hydratase, putative [Plasmodium gallinaceum]|uniref:Enoyl-CoA hydratase, putative n=1 Tax=Plasmodium gallinaceum TaxID=5849 RepID=A0A1J1GTD7_PLAGA|nr:enoyl-CoA hydratase, putative [Plasmodium gallinaceum]CRG95754.1 enoyl-CoA hydratase, putative [Plasmodium gallinaceum]
MIKKFLNIVSNKRILRIIKENEKCDYKLIGYKKNFNCFHTINVIDENKENSCFTKHKYVDFFRDETRNIGIITFKNINDKINIFHEFLDELKNVIEHINNIISNEENNTFYIKEFKNKDNYLIKNIKNRIPYYDNKLKIIIINSIINDNTFLNSLDYNSYLKNDEETNSNISNSFRYLCNNIQNLPLITISNINGLCINSGIDLILSTDFRISNEKSKFGFDKTYIGLFPYGGSTQKLFRNIQMNYSKYLLLTNQVINANDALKMNLIDVCLRNNENFFIDNSNVFFENNLSHKEKFSILKENIIEYFQDIFKNKTFEMKIDDDSFIFTLFFSFQFLFIPTYILQNTKLSINEGISLIDVNSYLDYDKNIFEKNINSSQRLDILNYIKKKKK